MFSKFNWKNITIQVSEYCKGSLHVVNVWMVKAGTSICYGNVSF